MTYTDEQVLEAIGRALDARDLELVAGLLKVLAVQAPESAQLILDVVELARQPVTVVETEEKI